MDNETEPATQYKGATMSDTLVIPIYLNQRTVFDMLAMLEDGFSHLETVQTSRKRGSTTEGGGEAEIGASNIFALLGVSLKGHLRGKKRLKSKQFRRKRGFIHLRHYLRSCTSALLKMIL